MAGGLSIGIIGGSPLMKVLGAGGKVTGNRLPLTKSLDGGGGLGGLMSSVISGGGLQSIMSNPMGAIAGQLQSAISGAVGGLSAVGGASGLIGALTSSTGLSGAVSGLLSSGNGLLSGQGVLGLISHANIAEMAGSALPSGFGLDAVLGPLNADGLLGRVAGWLPDMVAQVKTGALPVADAVAQVEAHAAAIQGVIDTSSTALFTVAAMAPDIAAVSTIAASFVAAPAEIQAVLERAIPPETIEMMRASVASHLDDPA